MLHKNASFLDVVSIFSLRDSCVIMPTLDTAIYWWPKIIEYVKMAHGEPYVVSTKTGVVSRRTKTALRLWVPYHRDPTMPMDFEHDFKYRCDYIDFYGLMGGIGGESSIRSL